MQKRWGVIGMHGELFTLILSFCGSCQCGSRHALNREVAPHQCNLGKVALGDHRAENNSWTDFCEGLFCHCERHVLCQRLFLHVYLIILYRSLSYVNMLLG